MGEKLNNAYVLQLHRKNIHQQTTKWKIVLKENQKNNLFAILALQIKSNQLTNNK